MDHHRLRPDQAPLSVELPARMRDRFATGALLHFGQGKWYPGEAAAALGTRLLLAQRRRPIWENQNLLPKKQRLQLCPEEARRFLEALTRRLQVSSSFIVTAYEDIFFHLWRERAARNRRPARSQTQRILRRARLAQLFEKAAATTNRLRRASASHPHSFRHTALDQPALVSSVERMFLTPGDSPLGYRLPLEAMPWTRPEDVTYAFETDPFRNATSFPRGRSGHDPVLHPTFLRRAGARGRQAKAQA